MFEVTAEWVKSHQSVKGGWNRAQLEILGVKWPPTTGWVVKVAGRLISDDDKRRFEQLQGLTLKRRKEGESRNAKLFEPLSLPANGHAGSKAPASHRTPRDTEE